MSDFFTQMASRTLLVRSAESSPAFTLPKQKEGTLASPVLPRQAIAPLFALAPALEGEPRVEVREQAWSSKDEREPRTVYSLVERSRLFGRREKTRSESEREEVLGTMQPASPPQQERMIIASSRQSAEQKERLQRLDRLSFVPQQAIEAVFSPTTYVQQQNGLPTEQNQSEQPQQLIKEAGFPRLDSVFAPTTHMQQNRGGQSGEDPRQSATREASSAAVAPVIKVSIGRIEVRAVVAPAPSRQVAQAAAPRSALQEYLEARNQGKL
ncbi:hypothetical protein [Paenibacillus montanisoli]|uniref:Uncharacterized protein n=1 Tax=Paenibacillus montanisoli TaxID=2081970 RepID=A0A328U6V4_9BACL|nr:hypothetical protein [Paenibacillus montanisoli]RAP78299.1 hypothetical protein DL346_07680 [Paenibacillus montanisoli]